MIPPLFLITQLSKISVQFYFLIILIRKYGKLRNPSIVYLFFAVFFMMLVDIQHLIIIRMNEFFDVIWCNNIFEHLLSPHSFLVHLKKFSHKNTILILGTPVIPVLPSLTKLPKFRGALCRAHVNFFNYKIS